MKKKHLWTQTVIFLFNLSLLILIQLLPVITVEDLIHICLQLLSNPKLKQSR